MRRQSVGAVALVRRQDQGQALYLAQWNRTWGAFHLIGGHKRPQESFPECLIREVGEELGLAEGTDFAVPAEPLAHLEFEAWSESARVETSYVLEVFEVELTGPSALAKV